MICQFVYYSNLSYELEEVAYFLYQSIVEDVLPIGFYSLPIEPLLLTNLFNRFFEMIDPHSFAIMKDLPGLVFVRYFMSLFTEMRRESVAV